MVPANLRDQWRDTLDTMFHIDATIVAGHLLPALERRLLPGQSVWATHDVAIASIDYLKTRTEEVLSHGWDLVLVDEAHLAAQPHTEPGRAAPDMERFAFVREAAGRRRHLLLLTATPHNGYADSYASLFRMLDPILVQDGPTGPRVQRTAAREHHVVQRRRSDIEEWYRVRGVRSPFPERRADEQVVDLRRSPNWSRCSTSSRLTPVICTARPQAASIAGSRHICKNDCFPVLRRCGPASTSGFPRSPAALPSMEDPSR